MRAWSSSRLHGKTLGYLVALRPFTVACFPFRANCDRRELSGPDQSGAGLHLRAL
jgi:hypothetical protein